MHPLLGVATLSAPPPVPLPELERPLTPGALADAMRAFHRAYYVEHPFHVMMHAGQLSPRQLQGWVANRLCYQRAIPRKDGAIIANCPDPAVRRKWVQRIIDHDGTREQEGGTELWIRLGVALGVPREEMESEVHVLPGVRMATEAYVTFCGTHPWVDGVASSLTELFAPDIMRRRLESLPVHYPWIDDAAYAYFRSRLVQAPRDSAHALEIVTSHCVTVETQRRAFEALRFKIEMLWVMIDTIHHAYAES
jgi:pyrroloquinoline-quinone synthase